MNKICTDIEQSKKLIELGLDVSTADMLWTYDFTVNDINGLNVISRYLKPEENDIPSWSLTVLLGLMPTFTLNGFGNGQFNCRDERANSYALVDTCPLDAAFETVCWLLENKKL